MSPLFYSDRVEHVRRTEPPGATYGGPTPTSGDVPRQFDCHIRTAKASREQPDRRVQANVTHSVSFREDPGVGLDDLLYVIEDGVRTGAVLICDGPATRAGRSPRGGGASWVVDCRQMGP